MDGLMQWGVGIIVWLQQFSPALDGVSAAFTFLGDFEFLMVLVPVIYWCLDNLLGARLMVLASLSWFGNAFLKALTNEPRPFLYDSRVQMLYETYGNSFPSFHTQNAVVMWGYLASQFRKRWFWALVGIFMVGVPLSRIYLGVHFPHDVLAGYLMGTLILGVFLAYAPQFQALLARQSQITLLIALFVLGALIVATAPDEKTVGDAATITCVLLGILLERRWVRFTSRGTLEQKALRTLLGITGNLAFWLGLKVVFGDAEPIAVFRFIRYGLLGLWISVGAPWAFVKLGLAARVAA